MHQILSNDLITHFSFGYCAITDGVDTRMNKILKATIRFAQGQRDCAIGFKPRQNNASYLKGYGKQYEREQRISALFQTGHYL